MTADVDDPIIKRIGTTLRDKWVLEELLGVGGMASVYAARHKIGRRDAIKILHLKIAQSEQLRARFEQEAHAVNAFKHPGVVEIRDVDTAEDGAPFLVMELLEGETLAQRLSREHSVEPREMLAIAAQVLDVLAAAHPREIIHRDIKPDNLFLSKDGKVKVLDFGIARVRSADRKAQTTKAGVTLGTMAYMPPEQARGEEIDGRADIYAVGATVFRAITGRLVHDVDSQAALLMRVIAHGAPRLRSIVRDVDRHIGDVVDRSLAFELEDRYPDAATMLADVRAVLEGRPPPYASSAPPIPERPRISALFDEPEPQGKPTVLPPARQKMSPPTPGEATQVGQPSMEPHAIDPAPLPATVKPGHAPSARPVSAPTRVSSQDDFTHPMPAVPLSDRVVIVPSRKGDAVRVHTNAMGAPTPGSDIATVYGLAPPPGVPAAPTPRFPPPRAAEPVLTPFAELSAFIRKGPSVTLLAIAGGAAVLVLVLLIVAIAWLTSSSASNEGRTPAATTTATATTTAEPTRRPRP